MAVNYQAPTFSGGTPSSLALTQAFADIELALRNAIGINGDLPNAMEEDLDLNGHQLLNVGKIGSVLVDSDDLDLVINRVVANEADIATLQGLRAIDQILLSQTIARLDDLQEIEVIEDVFSRLSSVETDINILKATDNDLVPRVTALEAAPDAVQTFDGSSLIAQAGVAIAAAVPLRYTALPGAVAGEVRLGSDEKPYEFVTGNSALDPATNWVGGTWKFVGDSGLPENLPVGDTILTLADISPEVHYLRYDILENGAGSVELPEGLPIGQEIHIRIPSFSADALFTGMIGDGDVELIVDNNGRFGTDSDVGFKVSNVAGLMILRKIEDRLWKRDFQVASASEPGVRFTRTIPFGVVSAAGDNLGHLIKVSNTANYSMDYGDGNTENLTDGSVKSYTYPAAFDGEASITLEENSYPREFSFYRENYKDPVDFVQRLNARNTLTDLRMDLSDPDFNIEDMTAGATNIETFTSRSPAGSNVKGSLGQAIKNMPLCRSVDFIGAVATEDTTQSFFSGFEQENTSLRLNTNNISITGDHGAGLDAMTGTFNSFRVTSSKIAMTGDFEHSHQAERLFGTEINYSFDCPKTAYTGTINNSNDFFKKLKIYLADIGPSTFSGSWNTALAGCSLLETLYVQTNHITTTVDYGTLLDEIQGKYIRMLTEGATATCSKAPAFPASLSRFECRCLGLTSAEVDLIFEGIANNVTTYPNGSTIIVAGGAQAPTALTTGTGGYIDQIQAVAASQASPVIVSISHN